MSEQRFLELERLRYGIATKKVSADDCRTWIIENAEGFLNAWREERKIANDRNRATSELKHLRARHMEIADSLKEVAGCFRSLANQPDCPPKWRELLEGASEKYLAIGCHAAEEAREPKPVGRDDRVIVVAPQRRLEYGRVTVTRVTVTPSGNLCYQLPHICFTAPMTRIARSVVPGLPHHVT